MAVRQYIGARYVTKIYENSLDPSSAEWEAGVTYEPLTLVTFLNSSYLSKKEVPGSVGDPASNPTYWVVTGAYNGQIAQLQNEIDGMRAETKRKIIAIGDSFGYGTINAGEYTTGWIETLENLYPDVDVIYLTRAQALLVPGNIGFTSGHPAINVIQEIESYNPSMDKDSITDIVYIGGSNDAGASENTIKTALATFVNYCKNNYKNARLRFGIFGVDIQADDTVVKAYQSCIANGAGFMMDLWGIVNSKQDRSSSGHLTIAGYAKYVDYVADSIVNGRTDYTSYETASLTPTAPGDTGTYDMHVINTADSVNIYLVNQFYRGTTNSGTVNIPITGDAIIIENAHDRTFDVTCYGSDDNWATSKLAGFGKGYTVNGDTLRLLLSAVGGTFTDYVYVIEGGMMQKRNKNTIV